MNLVQKLPIGLGLACMMLLSSCSKEDVQTPEPKVASVNEHSNEKTASPPWVFGTKGFPGQNILPGFWERNDKVGYPSDPTLYPVGTSSPSHLWGNASMPWLQLPSLIPNQPWNSFITVKSSTAFDVKKQSRVKTKMGGLTPGKKYALKVYVATTLPKIQGRNTQVPHYAKSAVVSALYSNQTPQGLVVDLTNSKNTWVPVTLNFTAIAPEMDLTFRSNSAKEGEFSYAHIFVGSGVITQLN
ncbi:hypothetical protein [Dyadobacter crusticola]|uniref:hypothetical protein n=1 Tax=Dyadobacter crusticola TaxID=292407 RepID=UPI0004E18902|nr:hypothetical protein [Dyadobacter crusticola]